MPPTTAAAEGIRSRGVASKEKCAGQAHEQQAAKQPELPGRAGMRMHCVEALEKSASGQAPKGGAVRVLGVLLEAACGVYGNGKEVRSGQRIWTESDQHHDAQSGEAKACNGETSSNRHTRLGAPGKSQQDEQASNACASFKETSRVMSFSQFVGPTGQLRIKKNLKSHMANRFSQISGLLQKQDK